MKSGKIRICIFFLISNNIYCRSIRLFPWFLEDYLHIDKDVKEKLFRAFNENVETLKGIDIDTYFSLKGTLDQFEIDLNNNYFPITDDLLLIRDENILLLTDLLKENLTGLKEKILTTSKEVSEVMHKKLKSKINQYERDQSKFNFDVPNYLLEVLNRMSFLKEKVTIEDLRQLYSTPAILWLIEKFGKTEAFKKHFEISKSEALQVLMNMGMKDGQEAMMKSFWLISDPSILKITFSIEDQKRFIVKNSEFKKTFLIILTKCYGKDKVPAKALEFVKMVYNGKASISGLWNRAKGQLEKVRQALEGKAGKVETEKSAEH
ncbi:MAG: hypothetical protein IPI65_16950 [Bacteroidetes bacterium]|nr:hypothetical protein [Bacteroidota bacterium]